MIFNSVITLLQRMVRRLQPFEFWVVSTAALLSVLSERLLPVSVVVGLAGALLRTAAEGRFSRRTRLDWPILLLGLMLPVTLLATAIFDKTLIQVLRLIVSILLYYEIVNWTQTQTRLRLLAVGLVWLALAVSVGALFQVNWFTEKFSFLPLDFLSKLPSLGLARVHPNVLAGTVVMLWAGILAGLFFSWTRLTRIQKGLLSLVSAFMALILVFTQSRGAIMGASAAVALLVLLRFRRGRWMVLAGAVVIAGVILKIGPGQAIEMLSQNTGSINSLAGRLEIWSRALYMIRDFPFTGIGMGTYTDTATVLYQFFIQDVTSVTHAHNLYLQVAVDLGIPGFIAWAWAWVSIIITAAQVYRKGRTYKILWQTAWGAALLCAQAAVAVHGLWDAVTWGTRPVILVWVIWGITGAVWQLSTWTGNGIQGDQAALQA